MKKRLNRLLAIILAMTMVALCANAGEVVSQADDDFDEYGEYGYYDEGDGESYGGDFGDIQETETYTEEPGSYEPAPPIPGTDDRGESEDPEWHDDDYNLIADTYNVGFGKVVRGAYALEYLPITVSNTSNNSINLAWYKSDAEKVFSVDAPSSLYLGGGESTKFYVTMKTDYYTGSYSATLLIGSDSDPDFTNGVSIQLTGTIVDPEPIIYAVEVYPSSVSMSRGAMQSFTASVYGDFDYDPSVRWSVSGNTDSKTQIDSSGHLTIGNDEDSSSLRVTATSVADSDVSDYASVTINESSYSVTTCSNPANGGTTVGGGTVKRRGDITVNAAPNKGFTFVNWTLDGKEVSKSPLYEIKGVRGNMSLVANFKATSCYVKVSKNIDKGGKVTESKTVKYGDNVLLEASPNSGYSFDGWYEAGRFISDSRSITVKGVTSDREIVAKFTQNVFNVQVQANPTNVGMVSGSGNYSRGSNVAISAKPIDGYRFVSWTVNNEVISTEPNCTIKNIDRDFVVVAIFEQKQVKNYEIAATVAQGSGVISPSGLTRVAEGSSMVYTFAPANGYIIAAVAVDGTQVGAVSSYAFSNISSNHSIAVAFTPKPSESGKITKDTPKDAPGQSSTPDPLPVVKNDENGKMTDEVVTYDNHQAEADAANSENNVTPEITGNDEYVDYDNLTGVMQEKDMTETQARGYIDSGNDIHLLELAARDQILKISVHNEYAQSPTESENTSFMNLVSIPNLQDVVDSIFTSEEKVAILGGQEAGININIFNNNDLKTNDDKEIERIANKDNVNVGDFFEIVMMKTYQGSSSIITQTDVPMKMVIKVPEGLKANGRQFCVIRAHQGRDGVLKISFLQDLDDNPSTITFETGEFSSYAIGYLGGEESFFNMKNIIVFIIILLSAAVVVTVIGGMIISGQRRKRRRRR